MNNSLANSGLASVTNALRLLSMLSQDSELRVVDVASRLDVAPSTSHRLLKCLKEAGFMQQVQESRRYRVGPELLRLARYFSSQNSLEHVARPHLVALCRRVNEAVNLQILLGHEVLCLEAVVEDRHDLHVNWIAGRRVAAHASAAGKVLLAALPQGARQELYEQHGLPAITSRTITSTDVFETELRMVLAMGYATNMGEREDGVHAVAVPVLDLYGNPMAALAVAAPAVRLPAARIPGLVRDLHRTRADIRATYFRSPT